MKSRKANNIKRRNESTEEKYYEESYIDGFIRELQQMDESGEERKWFRISESSYLRMAVYISSHDTHWEGPDSLVLVLTPGHIAYICTHEYGEAYTALHDMIEQCACGREFQKFLRSTAFALSLLVERKIAAGGWCWFGDYFRLPEDIRSAYIVANTMIACCDGECVKFGAEYTFGGLALVSEKLWGEFKTYGIEDSIYEIEKDFSTLRSLWCAHVRKRARTVRELLWKSYPHICGICGKEINNFKDMQVDHIVSLALGGDDVIQNLQLAHAHCNLSKGAGKSEQGVHRNTLRLIRFRQKTE